MSRLGLPSEYDFIGLPSICQLSHKRVCSICIIQLLQTYSNDVASFHVIIFQVVYELLPAPGMKSHIKAIFFQSKNVKIFDIQKFSWLPVGRELAAKSRVWFANNWRISYSLVYIFIFGWKEHLKRKFKSDQKLDFRFAFANLCFPLLIFLVFILIIAIHCVVFILLSQCVKE